MPKNKANIHVVPSEDGWRVEREGQDRAVAKAGTQKEAAQRGREVARKDQVEFYLHGRDGQIREKDSYGNDPRNIPG